MDSDEISNDKEVCDFINHGYHQESNYKKKWYKENAQKISQQRAESYNPEKRKASYRVCNKRLQIYLSFKVLEFYFFLALDEVT